MSKNTLRLNRLLNADGEVVGYFSDHVAEMAARREWHEHYDERVPRGQSKLGLGLFCRSIATPIVAAELEDVELGDGDRVDYLHSLIPNVSALAGAVSWRMYAWPSKGAASVEARHYLINRYYRPGRVPYRDADLGGPTDAAGVLYVLTVKAPK